jgi:hypothetical protein
VNNTFISDNFDEFSNIFPTEGNVSLHFKANSVPKLTITSQSAEVVGTFALHILNPMKKDIDAIKINCSFTSNVNFVMNEEFLLLPKLSEFKIEASKLHINFKSATKLEKIQTFIEEIEKIVISEVNKDDVGGVKIPFFETMKKYVGTMDVKLFNDFIVVEADPVSAEEL